jgi:hypothetical protein
MAETQSETTRTDENFRTPSHQQGWTVTDAINNALHDTTNDDEEPNPKHSKYIKLTPDQLLQILTDCSSKILSFFSPGGFSQASQSSVPPPTTPAYYNNAKYEEICSHPIKPQYDGSENGLTSFLMQLDIQ